MKTNYEIYRDEMLKDPDFRVKYLLAKEKLNLELMIDSIDEAVAKSSSSQTMKRRISKLRRYVASLSL